MFFADLLSLHLVTFLMFFILYIYIYIYIYKIYSKLVYVGFAQARPNYAEGTHSSNSICHS